MWVILAFIYESHTRMFPCFMGTFHTHNDFYTVLYKLYRSPNPIHHRTLSAFLNVQKTTFNMIKKIKINVFIWTWENYRNCTNWGLKVGDYIEKCDNLKWIRNTALYIYALYKRSDFLATTDVQKMLWKILKSCWITWINYSDSIGLLCVVIFSLKCLH